MATTLSFSPFRISLILISLSVNLLACTPAPDATDDNTNQVKVDERMTTDITPANSFTNNSYDNIKVGADFDPELLTQNTDSLDGCFGAQSANHPDTDYMIIDNKVVEIGTWSESIASVYGVKVGDSLEHLYEKHQGHQPEVTDSPYGTPNENIIIYYWYKSSNQGREQRVGTKYQVDNNIVTSISIGLESALRLWEGCA